ncbi:X core protein [Human mastadenovirus A]|uniref:PX protein n=2 Tax=Human mastadenovirus A TaxID=129875 RepID=D0Z5T0_ADE31|nr:L2 pX [Human adenovirus 61]AYI49741.1 X core protein [Human adenovirus 31]UNB10566.1 X core protein [Human mastadenovirus A]UNA47917.1 pX protein [Human adenovirus 31]UNA47951.1 pX protein [Human adenovirus 31]
MALTCRMRIPIPGYRGRSHRRRGLTGNGRFRRRSARRRMKGGVLPLLIPLIAAAIGAVPGIASVALQASRKN